MSQNTRSYSQAFPTETDLTSLAIEDDVASLRTASGFLSILSIKSANALRIIMQNNNIKVIAANSQSAIKFGYRDFHHILSLSVVLFLELVSGPPTSSIKNENLKNNLWLFPEIKELENTDDLHLLLLTSPLDSGTIAPSVLNLLLKKYKEGPDTDYKFLFRRHRYLARLYIRESSNVDVNILENMLDFAIAKSYASILPERILNNPTIANSLRETIGSTKRFQNEMLEWLIILFRSEVAKINGYEVFQYIKSKFNGSARDLNMFNQAIKTAMYGGVHSGDKQTPNTPSGWEYMYEFYIEQKEQGFEFEQFIRCLNLNYTTQFHFQFGVQYMEAFPETAKSVLTLLNNVRPQHIYENRSEQARLKALHVENFYMKALRPGDTAEAADLFFVDAIKNGGRFPGITAYKELLPRTAQVINGEVTPEIIRRTIRRKLRQWRGAKEFNKGCHNDSSLTGSEWKDVPPQYRLKLPSSNWCFDVRDLIKTFKAQLTPSLNTSDKVVWPRNPYTNKYFNMAELNTVMEAAVNGDVPGRAYLAFLIAGINSGILDAGDFFTNDLNRTYRLRAQITDMFSKNFGTFQPRR